MIQGVASRTLPIFNSYCSTLHKNLEQKPACEQNTFFESSEKSIATPPRKLDVTCFGAFRFRKRRFDGRH